MSVRKKEMKSTQTHLPPTHLEDPARQSAAHRGPVLGGADGRTHDRCGSYGEVAVPHAVLGQNQRGGHRLPDHALAPPPVCEGVC